MTNEAENTLPRVQYGFKETAQMIGIPISTLEQECRRGDGPLFYKVGRRKFTTLPLINDWLSKKIEQAAQGQQVQSTSQNWLSSDQAK